MLEMYIFETSQNIVQLETIILESEKESYYSTSTINEIFRIMHTIKGSSSMMLFTGISALAHSMEDLFYYIREQTPKNVDYNDLSDLLLEGVDFIKTELGKIENGDTADGNASSLIESINEFLIELKQKNSSEEEELKPEALPEQVLHIPAAGLDSFACKNFYKANVLFEDGCGMENIRAYTIIQSLGEFTSDLYYFPEDILDNDNTAQYIRQQGFNIHFRTDKMYEDTKEFFKKVICLKSLELVQIDEAEFNKPEKACFNKSNPEQLSSETQQKHKNPINETEYKEQPEIHSFTQSMISVNVEKLDKLMDLMGEMVIAEAMVTQNPDLKGLPLGNFRKSARQLHKITSEMQDMVMAIRMVPLSMTFQKMHRIVRDMSKKLGKEVELKLVGEETEVDKNIIEHISDPLMHLVRNSIDHGIEAPEDREALGKARQGTVALEAKNAGNDVLIIVKDDGKGLDKAKILEHASKNGMLSKSGQDMSDREIYNLIFLPGFSTKDQVSEFSGRGVGMDVVMKNIEAVGGTVSVESTQGGGSAITLKIPLTLAIIDGMNVKVGESRYTIPTNAIKESFRPKTEDVITDPDGNEMIMVRGECYPIIRLHKFFGVKTDIAVLTEGILIMTEQEYKSCCMFADALLGQQQVVVKTLPNYIKSVRRIRGLTGCTLLGDGSISLIIDPSDMLGS